MVTLRSQKLKSGKFSLYLDIYHNGQRYYDFLKIYVSRDYTSEAKNIKKEDKEKWELASNIRLKRELELKTDEYGFVASFKKSGNFIDYFRSKLKIKNHRTYDHALKHVINFSGENLSFKAINEKWANDFRAYLLENIPSHNTAFHYFQRVKIILNMAIKDKIIIRNPFDFAESLAPKPGKRPHLDQDQLQNLFRTEYGTTLFQIHTRKAFLFSCFSGLRLSDVMKFRWTEIQNGKIAYTQKKTDKNEWLPLPETAMDILAGMERSPDNDRVFFGLKNQPTAIGEFLRNWAKEAKVEKHLTFHVARHTFATLLITYDTDLYTVSKLLGHSDIRMTQIYAKIVDKKKDEAVARLPKLTMKDESQRNAQGENHKIAS